MYYFCCYPKCHHAECHYAECHYAGSHNAECHYSGRHYAECRSVYASTIINKLIDISTDGVQEHDVKRIVVITDGQFVFNDSNMSNDIALIELSQPLLFDATVQPACLPTSGLKALNLFLFVNSIPANKLDRFSVASMLNLVLHFQSRPG